MEKLSVNFILASKEDGRKYLPFKGVLCLLELKSTG